MRYKYIITLRYIQKINKQRGGYGVYIREDQPG